MRHGISCCVNTHTLTHTVSDTREDSLNMRSGSLIREEETVPDDGVIIFQVRSILFLNSSNIMQKQSSSERTREEENYPEWKRKKILIGVREGET